MNPDDLIRVYAANYECPDCCADTELTQLEPGIGRLLIRHDDTCPTFKTMQTA